MRDGAGFPPASTRKRDKEAGGTTHEKHMKNTTLRKTLWTTVLLLPALAAAACGGRTDGNANAATDSTTTQTDSFATARFDLSRCIYTAADSQKVERLLRETPGEGENDVLFFARRLTGLPYVAATLEKGDPEKLVVNLRQLDCTTLVETAFALAMTRREKRDDFASYCANLERLRYRDGRMDGYLSRLHYFTWWFHDNIAKGTVSEVELPAALTSPLVVDNHYMSRHADKYEMLRRHPEWTDSIAAMERTTNGPDGTYLPQENTGLPRKRLQAIEDGDLIAIVTTKDGLDYSHLGLAAWGKDGLLHLLNASSIHHKVVEEPKTLLRYLKEHPTSVGIRVSRLN